MAQDCHVVTDHRPKPLPPGWFALGTCVFCFCFIGPLVELHKGLWPPFIQQEKTNSHLSSHHLEHFSVSTLQKGLAERQVFPGG